MTLDLWGMGLQAINVVILIWLLSRVFWRPVAAAIAARQSAAEKVMEAAHKIKSDAEAMHAKLAEAQNGIAAERAQVLDAARTEATAASKATLAQARAKADALLETAKGAIAQQAERAEKANAQRATDLAARMAARLLAHLRTKMVQEAFLAQLIDAIGQMSEEDRAALARTPKGLEVVLPEDGGAEDSTADHMKITQAVQTALGGPPEVQVVTDPDLIAGVELRSPHFALRNSWQADLEQVRKAVSDAA